MRSINYSKHLAAGLCIASLFLGGCATEPDVFAAKELTPEQSAQLAALAPKVQQGNSAACYDAARIYRASHQCGKADQVFRFGAHFGTPQGEDYASLHCVEGLFHLYSVEGIWTWDSDYGTIMNNLNLANTYLNYLVAHHYNGVDPQLAKDFTRTGSQYPTGWIFDADSERSSLEYSANLAAQNHNTQAEGLSEISGAFNQALNTVAGSIH